MHIVSWYVTNIQRVWKKLVHQYFVHTDNLEKFEYKQLCESNAKLRIHLLSPSPNQCCYFISQNIMYTTVKPRYLAKLAT